MQNGSTSIPPEITGEDRQLVENQLSSLLASRYFKSAKQMQSFLKYIVEKTLAGEGQVLKQYDIAVEALSFSDDFNPDENPSVRIMAGRVRQRLDEYYDDESNKDELIIQMPKGSYIPEFKKGEDVSSNSIENQSENVSRGPILAIASFSDKTQSPKTNRLLLQLTDTIATEVSRFLFFKLVVCNPYSDKEHAHLIEEEMNSANRAEYILSLFLQKDESEENKYRLIYRLVFVETGEIVWSDNYVVNDKPIEEQDYVMGKLLSKVADNLHGMMNIHWSRRLLANPDTIPKNHEVLAYFRNYNDRMSRDAFVKGVNVCLEALSRNTQDAIANAFLAAYCRFEYIFAYGVIDSPLKKGKEYVETAIRINPNSHATHFLYGLILFCLNDTEHSLEEFELARSLCKNNITVEFSVGYHLCKLGQWDKGLKLVNKAMLFTPTYPSYYHVVPFLDHYRQGKYELALSEAKKITAPVIIEGPLARCISYGQLEMQKEAEKELQEVLHRCPKFLEMGLEPITRLLGTGTIAETVWAGLLHVLENEENNNSDYPSMQLKLHD